MKLSPSLKSAVFTVLIVTATIFAADKSEKPTRGKLANTQLERQRPKAPDRTRSMSEKMDPRARSMEMMVERQTKKVQAEIDKELAGHKAFIGKLENIKKSALKEKAKKTAEMITEVIEEKNKEFEQKSQSLQKRLEAIKERAKRGLNRGQGINPNMLKSFQKQGQRPPVNKTPAK